MFQPERPSSLRPQSWLLLWRRRWIHQRVPPGPGVLPPRQRILWKSPASEAPASRCPPESGVSSGKKKGTGTWKNSPKDSYRAFVFSLFTENFWTCNWCRWSKDGKSTWFWFWQKYLVLVCKEKTSAASGEADGLEDASWRSGSRVDIHDEGRFCQRAQSRQRESFHFPVRREGEEERGALVLAPLNRLGDHDRGALWQGVGGNLPLTGQRKRACPALRPNGQDQLVSLGGGHFASVLTSNNSSGHISTCCHDTLKVRPEGGMSL